MKLMNCIGYIDYLDINDFKDLDVGIEIQDFTQPELLDGDYMGRVEDYKEKLQGFDKPISIHGPFLDLKPFSPDLEIRRVSIEKYKKALIVARELKAEYIVFHSQINPWINEPSMRKLNNEMQRDFWNHILDEVDFEGTIIIENVFEDDPVLIKELIEIIDKPNIRICLDIGHSKLGCRSGLKYWIYELREYIEYVHLHWNEGKYDTHDYPTDENLKYVFDVFKEFNIEPKYAMEYEVNDLEKEVNRLKILYYGGSRYD